MKWCWRGRLHRYDGPAHVQYFDDGSLAHEEWCIHGLGHRDPKYGPAFLSRLGAEDLEIYELYDQVWRDPKDGPCSIQSHPDDGILHQRFSEPDEPPPRPTVLWYRRVRTEKPSP
jgi:hypothetical protein